MYFIFIFIAILGTIRSEPCPAGEYVPGTEPDCGMGLEPICPSPAHTARTGNCLHCWCLPGTLRVPGAGCVNTLNQCPRWRIY